MTTSWLGLRMQSENLILLERQRDRLTTALTVIEGRKRSGQAALTDVWQQQKLVESINVDQRQYQRASKVSHPVIKHLA